MSGGPTEIDRVRVLRDVLTATGAGIYLSNHIAGPIPAETMAAVHESDEMELRVGRAGPGRPDDLGQREQEARAVVAAALKGSPERVVLTHGAAEAARLAVLEIAARASGAPDRSRVLLHDGLEPSVTEAIAGVAAACAWQVDAVTKLPQILPADLTLAAFPHVDRDGRLSDLARAASAARAAGAMTLVDASLSVGTLPLDVASCGLDVVIADTSRWLLGPEGTAVAWLSPAVGEGTPERLRRSIGPFSRGTLVALARSVGWLLMYIELPWVIARTRTLSTDLHAALAAVDGVGVEAAPDGHGAVVAFRIEGWDVEQAEEELSRGVFAILEADTEADLLRASVGAWNSEEEIARFVERVAEIASHTPQTLPRKPTLTILQGPSGERS